MVDLLTQPAKNYHADEEDDEGSLWDDICPSTEYSFKQELDPRLKPQTHSLTKSLIQLLLIF